MQLIQKPKVIIGLGNPGTQFTYTRHNIGFRIIDELAYQNNGQWKTKDSMELAQVQLHGIPVTLVKPLTFMNNSGSIIPYFKKKGIEAHDILVLHDELELPFGKIAFRVGGSAKGHNGLKSIIAQIGEQFSRLRFGIGQPEDKSDVPHYVLAPFHETAQHLNSLIQEAAISIENIYK